jgi:glycyl-tRNA synthetase alpha chain
VGGIDLDPISCEITYGLERIAMFLQRVDNVFDLEWGGGVRYGEVRLQEEVEQSKYAFGQVDVPPEVFAKVHRDLFDQNYAFADQLLASNLVWPALEHCLKCSHLFNILDSSGSIGVTERTAYILRVRQLAVRIARAYVGSTQEPAEPGVAAAEGL